jgi:2-polyprenyl-3-methyl-5-hydroxy-6-metoxy-1,4-benzoquinol methylase
MLNEHLRQNGVMQANLTAAQKAAFEAITRKIKNGTYAFEAPACPTCHGHDFEPMAQKDRYGLPYQLVACRTCGLFQVSPRLNEESLKDFYALHYRDLYHGEITTAAAHSTAAEGRGRVALDLLGVEQPLLPGARIVEIGCAAGAQLLPFLTAGCDVAGYDYDDRIVALGRTENGLDLRFGGLAACAEDIAKGDPRPDAILYIHVLEHLSDPRAELELMAKILKPGGMLYLELPGMSRCLRTREMDFANYFEIAHTYHFDQETLVAFAESCGWRCLWSDHFVRAVLTPHAPPVSYRDATVRTIEDAEAARTLIETETKETDPNMVLKALLLGGASHSQAYFQVGALLFDHKNPLCVDYLERASTLAPERGKYTFMHARAMITHGRPDDPLLLATLERAVSQLPGVPSPLFHLGRALHAAKRQEEAIGAYAAAIRHSPKNGFFHYWLGLAYKSLGLPTRAASCFEEASALDTNLPYAHYEKGLALAQLARQEDAVAALDKAFALKPDPRFAEARARILAELPVTATE